MHFISFNQSINAIMKYILINLLFMAAVSVNGQTNKEVSLLKFGSQEFTVPAGCKALSEHQVQCDHYTLGWFSMNKVMLKTAPEEFVDDLSGELKDFKKQPISVFLYGEEVKGYKISFKNEATQKTGYQIIAYGIVNNQAVLVQLMLDKEPRTNELGLVKGMYVPLSNQSSRSALVAGRTGVFMACNQLEIGS